MAPEPAVAWKLAGAAGPCLTDHQRTMVFVEIGSGESLLAVERMLTMVAQTGFALPEATLTDVSRWLDCYVGSPEEQRLRKLLASLDSGPASAAPPAAAPAAPPTQRVQIIDVNPRVIARHSPPITCPVPQVAASIRDWFPDAGAVVHDTIDALQRTLCAGGYTDRLADMLNLVVEWVPD